MQPSIQIYQPRQLQVTWVRKLSHHPKCSKNTMQEYLRHWINFSFRSKQYFREIISRRISLMQSLPFIFQFISIPSVLYFSVIQVFMMLFFPGSRHTSCKRKIKWDKTIKLLRLIICYIELRHQYGIMIPNYMVVVVLTKYEFYIFLFHFVFSTKYIVL